VSVREQAGIIVERLRQHRTTTFRALIADCDTTLLVIGRFLALLELYREKVVMFEQITPLGDLTIRWTGSDDGDVDVTDEFDVEREVDRQPEGEVDEPVDVAGEVDDESEQDGAAAEQSQEDGASDE